MHGTMKTNRGEVIRIDLSSGGTPSLSRFVVVNASYLPGIRLRCRPDGRVTGKSKPNREGIVVRGLGECDGGVTMWGDAG